MYRLSLSSSFFYHNGQAASHTAQQLIADASCLLCNTRGRNPAVFPVIDQRSNISDSNPRCIGNIHRKLIHTDAPNNGSCKFSDSHIRSPIGIANRQIRDPAVPFGLEGSSIAGILPLGTSLINATLAFRASTGRRSSCKAVCSSGALSTPYRVPHPYIVTSQFRIIQQPIAALDVHIVSALSPGGYRYIPK